MTVAHGHACHHSSLYTFDNTYSLQWMPNYGRRYMLLMRRSMLCDVRIQKPRERHLKKLLDIIGKLRFPRAMSTNFDNL